MLKLICLRRGSSIDRTLSVSEFPTPCFRPKKSLFRAEQGVRNILLIKNDKNGLAGVETGADQGI